MSENGGNSKLSVFLAFLAGGLIGAGVTLLLTPSSGREAREKIKDASTQARDKAIEKATGVKQKADEIIEKGREKVTEKKAEVQAAVNAGKEAFHKRKDELLEESKEA